MKNKFFFCTRGQIGVIGIVLICVLLLPREGCARCTHISHEQQQQLAGINVVLISTVLVLPEGLVTPSLIQNVVVEHLQNVGLAVVVDPAQFHDAEIRVMCEEEKRETATTRYGG